MIWADAITLGPDDEFVERISECEPWQVLYVTARGGIVGQHSGTGEIRSHNYKILTATKRQPDDYYKRAPLPLIDAGPLWLHWRQRPRPGKHLLPWRDRWRQLLTPILGDKLSPELRQAADTDYQFAQWLHAAEFQTPPTPDPVTLYRGVRPAVGRTENGLFWAPLFSVALGYRDSPAENNNYDPADDAVRYMITADVPRAKLLWALSQRVVRDDDSAHITEACAPEEADSIYEVLVHLDPRDWHRMTDDEMRDAADLQWMMS